MGKAAGEILGIVEANLIGNFHNISVGIVLKNQFAGNAQAIVTDKLTGALTCFLLDTFGQQTLAHTNRFSKFRDIELAVHIVMLQDVGGTFHETLGWLRLLLIRFHTPMATLLNMFLIV